MEKQLDKLPAGVHGRVIQRVSTLANDPRPRGSSKPKGKTDEYRIRIGDYRVRYEVRDDENLVLLLYCKHRKDVYKTP